MAVTALFSHKTTLFATLVKEIGRVKANFVIFLTATKT
jgi:hypothetical protein